MVLLWSMLPSARPDGVPEFSNSVLRPVARLPAASATPAAPTAPAAPSAGAASVAASALAPAVSLGGAPKAARRKPKVPMMLLLTITSFVSACTYALCFPSLAPYLMELDPQAGQLLLGHQRPPTTFPPPSPQLSQRPPITLPTPSHHSPTALPPPSHRPPAASSRRASSCSGFRWQSSP